MTAKFLRKDQPLQPAVCQSVFLLALLLLTFSVAAQPPADVPTPAPKTADPKLELSISAAVLQALQNNVLFRLERLNPLVREQLEEIQRAPFDPAITADATYAETNNDVDSEDVVIDAAISRYFATGTTAALSSGYQNLAVDGLDSEALSWDVLITQALLRGRGRPANLARLHQAMIDTEISRHELQAVAETLVASVEKTYWDCVLAQQKINIYERSLEVAEQQIAEVREQVNIGRVAELELAAAEAEVAEKHEELIAARGELAKRLLQFRRLLSPKSDDSWWTRPLDFADTPEPVAKNLDSVENHVQLGLKMRPEIAQARLLLERDELEVIRTRDGLLPQLDLFVRLGGTHYSKAFSGPGDGDDEYDTAIGVSLAFPLGLRREKAQYRIAQLDRRKQDLALTNLKLLLQLDVRSAYVDVEVASEQIVATAATRKLRQDTLTAEQEKFRVGTSTTLQVSQAWRDLLASQISEIEAVVVQRKALIDLYRLNGSLLERRGIDYR